MIGIQLCKAVSGHWYEIGHIETVRDTVLLFRIKTPHQIRNIKEARAEAKKHGTVDGKIYIRTYVGCVETVMHVGDAT